MGHHYRLPTDTHSPGVGIILTKTTVNCAILILHRESLANVICLKGSSTEQLELALKLLGLITSAQCYSNPLRILLMSCIYQFAKVVGC